MFDPRTKIVPQKDDASSATARRRPGNRRTTLIVAGLVAVAAAAGGVYWYTADSGTEAVLTQKVVIGDIEDVVTAQGTVQPLEYVDVGTQVSGRVEVLHVDYNDRVTQGQLLAEIDDTVYQTRVESSEAQLLNLKAQLIQRGAERDLAQLQFERQRELLKENATSKDAFDNAQSRATITRAQIESLKAQIQQTESTLRGDRANLGYTKIHAPMDGIVVNVIAKQGQTLNANQSAPIVLRIAKLDTMKVWAEVSEADVSKLRPGITAYFTTLGQPGKRYYGKLIEIIPTPKNVQNVVLYNSIFEVANPDLALYPDMTAQVFFVTAEARGVPVVPVSALRPVPRAQQAANGDVASGAQQPSAATAQVQNGNADAGQRRGGGRQGGGQQMDQAQREAMLAQMDPAQREAFQAQRRQRGGQGGQQAQTRQFMVKVKQEDGKIVDRTVEVGVMTRLQAEVKSGLIAGDEVVLDLPAAPKGQPQNRQQQGGFPGMQQGFPGGGGGGRQGGGLR